MLAILKDLAGLIKELGCEFKVRDLQCDECKYKDKCSNSDIILHYPEDQMVSDRNG